MKTKEELSKLKIQWRHDPIWDIEETEGFEEHYEELLQYRERIEQKRDEQRAKEIKYKADEIGMPGNTQLAEYIIYMEFRIKDLEEVLRELKYTL